MHGTLWRHTRVSLVGCCWCFSFWRGVFHLYLLAYFPLHIFWEICPLTLLVLSVSIHTFSCSEEAKIDSTAPSDKGVCFLLHLFTIREVPALRREWVYCIFNKWMKTTRHLFEKCTQCIHEANGCSMEGMAGTLLNACNKSCKKQNKTYNRTKNRCEYVLTSAASPCWKQGKHRHEFKPSYVTMSHKNKQNENQILPLIHIYPQQHVQVSQNRSPFYTSDTLFLFLDHDQTLMLFLAPSKKKKTLTKTSLRSVTWSAYNVH